MKLAFLVVCLLYFFQNAALYGAKIPPGDVQSISNTAIRWLIFDDWGKGPVRREYSSHKDHALENLREHLKNKSTEPLPVEMFVDDKAVALGFYGIPEGFLKLTKETPPTHWESNRLYIKITRATTGGWKVTLKCDAIWTSMEIARDGGNYYVTSHDQTWIVD